MEEKEGGGNEGVMGEGTKQKERRLHPSYALLKYH